MRGVSLWISALLEVPKTTDFGIRLGCRNDLRRRLRCSVVRMRKFNLVVIAALAAMAGACTENDWEDEDDDNMHNNGGGGGGGGSSCSPSADNCAGETICVNNACVAAFPRVYAITNVTHMVSTTTSTGAGWDVGNGAPDLFVTISVNNTVAATTSVVADQFSASWAGPFSVQLIAGSTLALNSYDEDLTTNDPGYQCGAPITAALLRSRELGCTTATWSMAFRIAPQ